LRETGADISIDKGKKNKRSRRKLGGPILRKPTTSTETDFKGGEQVQLSLGGVGNELYNISTGARIKE